MNGPSGAPFSGFFLCAGRRELSRVSSPLGVLKMGALILGCSDGAETSSGVVRKRETDLGMSSDQVPGRHLRNPGRNPYLLSLLPPPPTTHHTNQNFIPTCSRTLWGPAIRFESHSSKMEGKSKKMGAGRTTGNERIASPSNVLERSSACSTSRCAIWTCQRPIPHHAGILVGESRLYISGNVLIDCFVT